MLDLVTVRLIIVQCRRNVTTGERREFTLYRSYVAMEPHEQYNGPDGDARPGENRLGMQHTRILDNCSWFRVWNRHDCFPSHYRTLPQLYHQLFPVRGTVMHG